MLFCKGEHDVLIYYVLKPTWTGEGVEMTTSTTYFHAKSKLYVLKSSHFANFPKFQIGLYLAGL